MIQELRIEKESIKVEKENLENENKDKCMEFNGRIYELNEEIKCKNLTIEHLSVEKEVLLSDIKNIIKDRDHIQKENSVAIKMITELVMNDSFIGFESKDLGNLEISISWMKEKCLELNNIKVSNELEIVNLRKIIQELEKNVASSTGDIKKNMLQIEGLKSDLDLKHQELIDLKNIIETNASELNSIKEFKSNIKKIGMSDDFDKIIEKLSQKPLDKKLESLTNEVKY